MKILQQQNTAVSERAVYEPAIGKMTLLGRPSLIVYPSSGQRPEMSFGGLVETPNSLPASMHAGQAGAASAAQPVDVGKAGY